MTTEEYGVWPSDQFFVLRCGSSNLQSITPCEYTEPLARSASRCQVMIGLARLNVHQCMVRSSGEIIVSTSTRNASRSRAAESIAADSGMIN